LITINKYNYAKQIQQKMFAIILAFRWKRWNWCSWSFSKKIHSFLPR